MGKKMASLALLLGAFLLALAAFSKFYMYDRLAVVPMNTTTTSIAQTAEGDDAEYLDADAGLKIVNGPLRSTRIVEGDVELSKQASEELGQDVAVWRTYSCTDTPDFECGSGETPLSGSVDVVAFDRNTGETVEWSQSKLETDGEVTMPGPFEGLYFKFPFDTQKKTYQFWDSTLLQAGDVEYVGEREIDGLTVYDFEQTIQPIKVGTIDVPGSLIGLDEATVTADSIYSNVRTYSVEPTTGVIVVGGEQQDNYLEVDGERVLTTTQASLQYTDENTQSTIDEYKSKAKLLSIIKTGLPVGGTIAGVLLIGLGVFFRRDRSDQVKGSRRSADRELINS